MMKPPPPQSLQSPLPIPSELQQSRRRRRPLRPSTSDRIPPPFPWAGDHRATVRPLAELVASGITQIKGELCCRSCDAHEVVTYDLLSKFEEDVKPLYRRVQEYESDRASDSLLNPKYRDCPSCGLQRGMRPVVAQRKRDINWLFMLLDGTLGCLNMKILAYFCRRNGCHSTGARDRKLYYAFTGLCVQLMRNQE
ncbi:hypothetical protein ACMD2_23784 [Ananas comosus]|uniref:DUF7086 domain-containing protein n=1 Tax=Ananas comosus TaxID=4615 RepID=A0A199V0W4_ANACO|nr:hypothetical protein ACMD2_23784 [Ananas comosus]